MTSGAQPAAGSMIDWRSRYGWLLLGLLFVSALGVRMYQIGSIDFAPLRQYRSAIIARAYYYDRLPAGQLPEWRRSLANDHLKMMETLEPPVVETLASRFYELAGGPQIWIPRALSALLWVLGGFSLLALAKRMGGPDEAFAATAFYLLVPFGVVASRAFMPHPMMVAFFCTSLYGAWLYFEKATIARLLFAGISGAICLLVYGGVLFIPLGACLGLSLSKHGLRRTIWGPFTALAMLMLLPAVAYYGYDVWIGGKVRDQIVMSNRMALFFVPAFWAGWLAMISSVVGLPAFLLGLIGLWLQRGAARAMLLGLWAGYIVFGVVFNYHMSTHDYYQLTFIPIIALSMMPVIAIVARALAAAVQSARMRLAIAVAIVILATAAAGVKIIIQNLDRQGRWQTNEREIAREVGEAVNHSDKVIFLSISAGYPLMYWGDMSGRELQTRNEALSQVAGPKVNVDSPETFFSEPNFGFRPEYFVVTEPFEFRKQPALVKFLDENYPVVRGISYIVYDLRTPIAK